MNINLSPKDIPSKLAPLWALFKKYKVFIFIILVLFAYSYLVLQIRNAITIEPSQAEITERKQDLQRNRLDQEAIQKIEDLESTNIEVQVLFQEARDNPFQE